MSPISYALPTDSDHKSRPSDRGSAREKVPARALSLAKTTLANIEAGKLRLLRGQFSGSSALQFTAGRAEDLERVMRNYQFSLPQRCVFSVNSLYLSLDDTKVVE